MGCCVDRDLESQSSEVEEEGSDVAKESYDSIPPPPSRPPPPLVDAPYEMEEPIHLHARRRGYIEYRNESAATMGPTHLWDISNWHGGAYSPNHNTIRYEFA